MIDVPGEPTVRVQYRRGGECHEMLGSHVIFCTGSLQNPHNPPLRGEEVGGCRTFRSPAHLLVHN